MSFLLECLFIRQVCSGLGLCKCACVFARGVDEIAGVHVLRQVWDELGVAVRLS